MPTETVDTMIIGAGLSGIYAAYLLSQRNKSFVVLEARERIGGRILCPEYQGFFSDLGPSWYWPAIHPKMAHLIQALGLKGYRQFEEGMGRFQSPNGAVQTVSGYAMEPLFWRQTILSGQAFSQCGPLGEIHDGSNNSRRPYGLTGFVGIPAVQRNHQQLLTEAILSQLAIIYGKPAARPTAFFYKDWAQERFTATRFDQPPMYEHPLYHPPAGQTSIWDGTIHFAGTETANQHGGYLEGALTAAERAVINQ